MWERLGGAARWGPRQDALLRAGVAVLLPLALVEAVLGRAMSVEPPPLPRTFASEAIGRFLLVLVTGLAVGILALILWALRARVYRLPAATDAIAVLSIGLLPFALASAAIADPGVALASRTLFLATAFVVLASVLGPERDAWVRVVSGLIALVYAASWVGSISGNEGDGWARIAAATAIIVPAPLAALARLGRSMREIWTAAFGASLVAAVFEILLLAWPAEVSAVALSGFGFALLLPHPLTAIAVWLAVASFALLVAAPGRRRQAYGIGLVMAAGIALRPAHVLVLALVGLLLWALREDAPEPVPAALPAPVPAAAPAKGADSGPAARSAAVADRPSR